MGSKCFSVCLCSLDTFRLLPSRVFSGRWCPAWMLVTVTLQALRRVSDDVGDADVIN